VSWLRVDRLLGEMRIPRDSDAGRREFERRYGEYLESIGGVGYREAVLAYIEKEDSPRSLTYQMDLLREVGFRTVEVLHKNSCFGAFGAIKAR
jgi:tRNA (cmo5U34)-methyltransferase